MEPREVDCKNAIWLRTRWQ